MSEIMSLLPKQWATTLEEILSRHTPTPVIVTAVVVPYAIAYLVHLPNTRVIRIGLYPIGILAFGWLAATIRLERVMSMRAALTVMTFNVGAGTRWAFSKSPPQYHPLPRPVPYPWLRNWLPFKAWDLLYNENRHINIAPYWSPLKRFPGSHVRLRRALSHLAWFWINTIIFDLASYPAMLIAPKTLGSPHGTGGDYRAWCRDLATQWGYPVFVVDLFWTACLFIEETAGFILLWDFLAFLGIASGVYIPEEWPRLTVHLFRATSLNELWGKRWHQVNRDFYLLLARPFSFYRPLHILAVFGFSALYHVVIYFPVRRTIHPLYPYLFFYIGQATCCILERAYYKTTGRKVGGVFGAIWTWSMIFLLARPMVAHEWSCGWAGTMRDQLAKEDGFSVVVKVFHALGWGPSQAEMAARAR